MSDELNFKMKPIDDKTEDLKKSLDNMDKELQGILMKFIEKMPELKSIIDANKPGISAEEKDRLLDRSEYNSPEEFWKGIAKDGEKPTLDDLIKYISENYSAEVEAESAEVINELSVVRTECIKACTESAKEILKLQAELITKNNEIIAQEKAKLEQSKRTKQEKEEAKASLEVERDALTDGPEKDEIIAKITEINGEIAELTRIIATLTTGKDSIEKHEKKQRKFKDDLQNNKKDIRILMGKQGIDLQQEQQAGPTDNNRGRPPAPTGQTRQEGTGGGNRTTQNNSGDSARTNNTTAGNENQTRSDSSSTQTTDNRTDKQIANDILRNFAQNADQIESLDGRGYGTLVDALLRSDDKLENNIRITDKEFRKRRRDIRAALKNRLDELMELKDETESNDNGKINWKDEILYVEDIMKSDVPRTPKEKKDFEDRMLRIKYQALIDATNLPFIGIFKTKSTKERIGHMRRLVEKHYDSKVEQSKKGFELQNRLRESVGKPVLNSRPGNHDASDDQRSNLQQRISDNHGTR